MAAKRRLAVTRRALEDLKLPTWRKFIGADPETFRDAHSLIDKLVHLRSLSPTGQEHTQGAAGVAIYNLHGQNPWRGVTWHDEEADIVWLCAASDHDYGLFLDRLANQVLLPEAADYADLEVWDADHQPEFFALAVRDLEGLLDEAASHPGLEVRRMVAGEVEIGIVIQGIDRDATAADVYIGVQYPRARVHEIEEDLTELMLLLCCPDARYEDVDWGGHAFPRVGGTRANEVVVRWRRP
jgi:hypothetical protein